VIERPVEAIGKEQINGEKLRITRICADSFARIRVIRSFLFRILTSHDKRVADNLIALGADLHAKPSLNNNHNRSQGDGKAPTAQSA